MSLVRFRPEAPPADLAHLVERDLAKVEVAGSSPVIRSIDPKAIAFGSFVFSPVPRKPKTFRRNHVKVKRLPYRRLVKIRLSIDRRGEKTKITEQTPKRGAKPPFARGYDEVETTPCRMTLFGALHILLPYPKE